MIINRVAMVGAKIGDIFLVTINESEKKYFQLIAFDMTMLNSDVIRVFDKSYPVNVSPDLNEIIVDKIDFYAHCGCNIGIKLGFWKGLEMSQTLETFTISCLETRRTMARI